MGEQVRAEQGARRAVVEPARGDQADRRLHDVDRPAVFPSSIVSARVTAVTHRFQGAAAVRLGAEIEPQRGIDIAGVALLDVEVPGERFHVVDRHELVQPQRKQRQRQPRAIKDRSARGSPAHPCRSRCRSAWRRRPASAGSCSPPNSRARWPDRADPAVERERMLQGVEPAHASADVGGWRVAAARRSLVRLCSTADIRRSAVQRLAAQPGMAGDVEHRAVRPLNLISKKPWPCPCPCP